MIEQLTLSFLFFKANMRYEEVNYLAYLLYLTQSKKIKFTPSGTSWYRDLSPLLNLLVVVEIDVCFKLLLQVSEC